MTKPVSITLDEKVIEKMQARAAKQKRSFSYVINEILFNFKDKK